MICSQLKVIKYEQWEVGTSNFSADQFTVYTRGGHWYVSLCVVSVNQSGTISDYAPVFSGFSVDTLKPVSTLSDSGNFQWNISLASLLFFPVFLGCGSAAFDQLCQPDLSPPTPWSSQRSKLAPFCIGIKCVSNVCQSTLSPNPPFQFHYSCIHFSLQVNWILCTATSGVK